MSAFLPEKFCLLCNKQLISLSLNDRIRYACSVKNKEHFSEYIAFYSYSNYVISDTPMLEIISLDDYHIDRVKYEDKFLTEIKTFYLTKNFKYLGEDLFFDKGFTKEQIINKIKKYMIFS